MTLAPGVSFDPEKHEYFFKGKRLSGVTGLISKKLGLKYNDFVSEHQEEGIHVHKAIQQFINTGVCESVHPGVQWLLERWRKSSGLEGWRRHSEVLVSDFKKYASSIDIVDEAPDGVLRIYDIKKGSFKRDYVTWQLSIYKYFAEKAGKTVNNCICICLRDQDYYEVFPKPVEEVEKLLYGG